MVQASTSPLVGRTEPLARLRGESLATAMRRHVFGPAGMRAAGMRAAGMRAAALPPGSTASPGVARGYDVDTDMPPLVVGDGWDGAGGVVALGCRRGRLLPGVVRPSTARRPARRHDGPAATRHGSDRLGGVRARAWPGSPPHSGEAVGHEGLVLGYSTAAWTMPRTGRSVVVLANSSARSAGGTFSGVLDIALCDR